MHYRHVELGQDFVSDRAGLFLPPSVLDERMFMAPDSARDSYFQAVVNETSGQGDKPRLRVIDGGEPG